jgi:hypothetical protein
MRILLIGLPRNAGTMLPVIIIGSENTEAGKTPSTIDSDAIISLKVILDIICGILRVLSGFKITSPQKESKRLV